MPRIGFSNAVLAAGMVFLYVPIFSLIAYSFNASRLVTIWGGFSVKWYGSLFKNDIIMAAAMRSLEVGVIAATASVILGTMAGYALARLGRFRGRVLFSGMMTAPLVMPDVITGISLLLMFITMGTLIGWPMERGVITIAIAHTTFCMCYVAVIIQSRLIAMDISLEEAAMDLGSRPLGVLIDVTLPIIAPAMLSGWLLSFTLSLDDLVISSFVAGPGATTLPLLIYSKVKLGVTPDINALATLMILVVTLAVTAAGLLMARRERRRIEDEQLAFAEAG
ncbi:MAG: ABC transporter permease subunit [Parvibaculaceae bacterium]|nr:ABC transporter permease subunit [Parvibaculaceae bacterium]